MEDEWAVTLEMKYLFFAKVWYKLHLLDKILENDIDEKFFLTYYECVYFDNKTLAITEKIKNVNFIK